MGGGLVRPGLLLLSPWLPASWLEPQVSLGPKRGEEPMAEGRWLLWARQVSLPLGHLIPTHTGDLGALTLAPDRAGGAVLAVGETAHSLFSQLWLPPAQMGMCCHPTELL